MMASQNDSIATIEYPGSSGASTTNESVLTQRYPQPSDQWSDADREFNSVIVKIAKQLDARNLETISFLMREELGPDREEMTGLAMLETLEKEGLFYAQDTANLEKILGECGRYDLINKHLKPYRRKFPDPAKEDSLLDESRRKKPTAEPPRKKRRLEEESTSVDSNSFDVSDVNRECQNASVHGIIVDVTPIRSTKKHPARKYFSACITDGKETLKFVCFNPAMRRAVEKMRRKKEPCTIENCTIKCSIYDPTAGDFELHHAAKTKVVANPSKKFEISNDQIYTSSHVLEQLSELDDATKGQIVTVHGKILSITDPEDVLQSSSGSKLRKQECMLADSGMLVPLKIWEGDIGKIRKGKCYRFLEVKVREYKGDRFLTTTEDSTIEEIDDIGEVTEEITLSKTQTEIRGQIAAVSFVSTYKACPSCNSKVDCISAECTKCHSSVALSRCKDQLFAKFTVQGESFTAFAEVISKIIVSDLQTLSESQIKRWLLSSDPALFRVNERGIVTSVERKPQAFQHSNAACENF